MTGWPCYRLRDGIILLCNMPPLKIGVGPKLDRAKRIRPGKGWRVVAPGKKEGRRAILIKKFKVGAKTLAVFQILPGTP